MEPQHIALAGSVLAFVEPFFRQAYYQLGIGVILQDLRDIPQGVDSFLSTL